MLKELIFLQTAGSFGTGIIGDLLAKWEELGFFSYLLPFLLIFALVFGILTKVQIFKDNKIVNGIIALAVAFMALQFSFVPMFFAQIFPRVGIGLVIILAIIVVAGLFIDPKSKMINYFLLGIGVLITGVIIVQSAGELGWQSAEFWTTYAPTIVLGVFILIVVFVVIGASAKGTQGKTPEPYVPYYAKE